MPTRAFDTLEERLESCSSGVRLAFGRLQSLCLESGGTVAFKDAAKREGRRFYVAGKRRPFFRLDPKTERIGIGFANDIRHVVAGAGLLRRQKSMAWITFRPTDINLDRFTRKDGEIAKLLRLANLAVRAGTRKRCADPAQTRSRRRT